MDAATVLPAPVDWHSEAMRRRRRARYAADRRLQIYGMVAVAFALGFLAILVGTLIVSGYKAFVQTVVSVELDLSRADIDRANLMEANWRAIVRDGLRAQLGEAELSRAEERDYFNIFTSSAPYIVRDRVIADPRLLDRPATFAIPLSDPLDQLAPRARSTATCLRTAGWSTTRRSGCTISWPPGGSSASHSTGACSPATTAAFPNWLVSRAPFPVRSGRSSSVS